MTKAGRPIGVNKLFSWLIICSGCGDTRVKRVDGTGHEVTSGTSNEDWRGWPRGDFPIDASKINPTNYWGIMNAHEIPHENYTHGICPHCYDARTREL